MPLAFDGTLLVVVVTLLEMSLGISAPTGPCANREHSQTLALFENQDQVGQYGNLCDGEDRGQREWQSKRDPPLCAKLRQSAIHSYGAHGGTRAVEHLR
jgi:hypothetical protein